MLAKSPTGPNGSHRLAMYRYVPPAFTLLSLITWTDTFLVILASSKPTAPTVMSNWILPWHYLATGPCLLANPKRLEAYVSNHSSDLKSVLDPEQTVTGGGPPPLISEITRIGQTHRQSAGASRESKQFVWDNSLWPIDLKLFIRDFSRLDEKYDPDKHGRFVLTHDTLYLRGEGIVDCPKLQEEDFNDPAALFSESFMKEFDDLVTSDSGRAVAGDKQSKPLSGEAIKRIILKGLESRGGIPTSLDINMLSGEQTTATRIEWRDDHFVLHLGWLRHDEATEDDLQFSHFDFGVYGGYLFIAEWPCGALE